MLTQLSIPNVITATRHNTDATPAPRFYDQLVHLRHFRRLNMRKIPTGTLGLPWTNYGFIHLDGDIAYIFDEDFDAYTTILLSTPVDSVGSLLKRLEDICTLYAKAQLDRDLTNLRKPK